MSKLECDCRYCAGCVYRRYMRSARNVDERTIAERKWAAPKLAAKPQQPMDIGLFGDSMDQLELDVEMFMPPVEDSA